MGIAAGFGSGVATRSGTRGPLTQADRSPATNGCVLEHQCEIRATCAAGVRASPPPMANGDTR